MKTRISITCSQDAEIVQTNSVNALKLYSSRGQRRGAAGARFLGLRVRLQPEAWILSLVSFVCYQV